MGLAAYGGVPGRVINPFFTSPAWIQSWLETIGSGAATVDLELGSSAVTLAGSRREGVRMLRLPGHKGRDRNDAAPGKGDEQPLDASALVEAELSAYAVTGEIEHGVRAQCAFEWFLGRNRLGRALYDFATGGCRDGLGAETVNANEGAESTLAFLLSLAEMRLAQDSLTSLGKPLSTGD